MQEEMKENQRPLRNENELNLSPASRKVVSVPSSGSKRRRLSINPLTGDFQLEEKKSNALKNIANEAIGKSPSVRKKTHATTKDRRSMSRRVSFATTAHVRFFDKDHDRSSTSTPRSSPRLKKDKNSKEVPSLNLSLDQSDSNTNVFQVPDLSSIRNSGDGFELRLSPKAQTGDSLPQEESATDMSISTERNSFEVTIKGSPGDMSLCMDDNSVMNMPIPTSSPERFVGPDTEPTGNRRDSIAAFFETAPPSPISDKSSLSTPRQRSTNASSTSTTPIAMSSPLRTPKITPKKSPRRSARKSPRISSARRDSVAAFFEPFQNSPLRNEIRFDESDQEDIDDEPSMDLMGDMSGIAKENDDMSIAYDDFSAADVLGKEESMNMTICIGGIKDNKNQYSKDDYSTPIASRIINSTKQTDGNENGDDDTIGRFFFNPTMEATTPRLFSSPMSNIDAKATPKIFATDLVDSDEDIPSRFNRKSDVNDMTMDVTRCVGGILRNDPGTPDDNDTFGRTLSDGINGVVQNENEVTEKQEDVTVASVHSFVSKMATPVRLPVIQQLNMNSTKIASSVKRLDSMLKMGLKQGTPSRKKLGTAVEDLNSDDKRHHEIVDDTKGGSHTQTNKDQESILLQANLQMQSHLDEEKSMETENKEMEQKVNRLPREESPTLSIKLQSEVQEATNPRRSPRVAGRASSNPISSSKRRSSRASFSSPKTIAVSPMTQVETPTKVKAVQEFEGKSEIEPVIDEDLLDEHLSIMDCSFTNESSSSEDINTLSDFFNATGVTFIDSELPGLEFHSAERTMDMGGPAASKLKLALILMPERELYHFGCTEMAQYIKDGKETIAEIESEIESNQPLIFYEYSKGSASERHDMLTQLKATYENVKAETMESYCIWQEKLMNPLKTSFEENLTHLNKDQKYLLQIHEHLDNLEEQANVTVEELRNTTNEKHRQMTDLAEAERATLLDLNDKIENKRKRIQELKDKLAKLNIHHDATSLENEQKRVVRQQRMEKIQSDQERCNQYVVADPKELLTLKEDFELLCHSHQWKLARATACQVQMIYDGRVEVKIEHVDQHWKFNVSLIEDTTNVADMKESGYAMKSWLQSQLERLDESCSVPSTWTDKLYRITLLIGHFDSFKKDLADLSNICHFTVQFNPSTCALTVCLSFAHLRQKLSFHIQITVEDLRLFMIENQLEFIIKNDLPFSSTSFEENVSNQIQTIPAGFHRLTIIGARIYKWIKTLN